MSQGWRRTVVFLLLASLVLATCGRQAGPAPTPTTSAAVTPASPAASPSVPPISLTPLPTLPNPTPGSPTPTPSPTPPPPATPPVPPVLTGCRLGTGLRDETGPILLKYKDHPGFVMVSTVETAQTYFPQLEGWIRVIGAPSLDALQQKAARAKDLGLEYEGLAYGLETGKSTPESEWQDLIGSTVKARALADQYGKLLVMGPGFKLMSANEDKYAGMSALADIWVFQTQQLQKNPPGAVYRQEAQRVIDLIRAGKPSIQIWAQITLPPDREPNAEEWLAYRQQIDDLVEGTYVGVYTWKSVDAQILVSTIDAVFAGACSGQ